MQIHPIAARCGPGPGRRGSVCVVVLMTLMILVIIGLSAVAVARVDRRRARNVSDAAGARAAARAAVEWGLLQVRQEANWANIGLRDANWAVGLSLPPATYSLRRSAYDNSDPINPRLTLVGEGRCGNAVARYQVVIVRGAWIDQAGWTQVTN
jgi:Tfp pilus assembly protein PilX